MVLIAVHGSASRSLPPERGTVHLVVEVEDPDRATAMARAAELHDRFASEAQAFVDAGAATRWTSDRVWVRSEIRYEGRDDERRVVQIAEAHVRVRFCDFDALSTWILRAGSVEGVRIDGIDWSIPRAHREEVERELRIEAVQDAVARAEAYATAIGGGPVGLDAVWEAGLRPVSSTGELRWAAQARARMEAEPGLRLRPEALPIDVAVTAEFTADVPS